MIKAGNYSQAEQLFQLAWNKMVNPDQEPNLPGWSAPYRKYLNLISITEAAQDLGLWDQAMNCSQQVVETARGEPLSHLNLARSIVLKAEFSHLCEIVEVTKHKPSIDALASDPFTLCTQSLENAKSILEPYQEQLILNEYVITNDQIYRWQARANIVYNPDDEANPDPSEILTHQLTEADSVALIYHLHHLDLLDPDSDSLSRIIKLARSYPRNPAVILQVALAIHGNNPADAMKSLQSSLDQNPHSNNPTTAFCNILLAKIALYLEKYDIAQEAAESAIEFWPKYVNEPQILTAHPTIY
jgi:tetratricopeptide (TPR) repeat protein